LEEDFWWLLWWFLGVEVVEKKGKRKKNGKQTKEKGLWYKYNNYYFGGVGPKCPLPHVASSNDGQKLLMYRVPYPP